MEELCDYCGEPKFDFTKRISIPLPQKNDEVGDVCCEECQLSYSKFILGVGHEEREVIMRRAHTRKVEYAPQPYFVKKYNPHSFIKREIWLSKLRKK